MVVNGFADNNVCFETFWIIPSHPIFYERNLGWDSIYRLFKLFIVSVIEYSTRIQVGICVFHFMLAFG
jgi:hypothetical protein